ncbi:hypothetical protein BYT27DRAFT_6896565 [Phlegmacium glaucopus]|nr:hypothetical protein BYT27DRAFT_6896565 [Phlegmacium glaucopus]
MDASTFGRSNNGNTEDRYHDRNTIKPILNLLSSSHSRAHMENERSNKPLDPLSPFNLQLSNLKLSKRSDKNNPSSNSDDRACPPLLLLQPQRRLLSQVPPRLSEAYFPTSTPRKSSPIPTEPPLASLNLQKANDNRASSPFLMSEGSEERAYTHSNRQRLVSPNPQASFRQLSLKRSDTHKSSTRAGPSQEICSPHYDEAVLLEQTSAIVAKKNQLQNQVEKLHDLHSYASQGLDECRSRLASTTSQLESTNADLLMTRASFASSKEKVAALESQQASMTASLLELKSELSVVTGDRERLREAHAQDRAENDQLRKRVEAFKKGIAALRERCDGRDMDFNNLKKAHDALCIAIDNAKKEMEESKNLANNALSAMEPLIDSDATLKRAADTKAVLKELQDDLAASQRVTDLLRDKLYNQSSLLIEARDRIRDLEEEKRGSLEELLQGRKEVIRNYELFGDVETKLETLAEKVASRELETIDVLANSAALTTELEVLKKVSESNDAELAALRVMKEESISKLLASQGVINAREKEIVSLKAEVKALGESKAELRALLTEAKKLLGEKEVELRAKDPNRDLEFGIKKLDAQVVSLKAALHTAENRLEGCQATLQTRETEIQRMVYDAERLGAELASSKTTTTKLRDDLEGFRSKEASTTCKYEVLLAELEQVRKNFRSQEQALVESKAKLKERLEVQSVGLFQSKEESSKLKTALAVVQEQKTSVDTLINLHDQRASSAELAVSLLETQLKEAQARIVDLKSHLHQTKAELKLAQEASVISEQTISSTLHEQANDFEKTVKDLEQQNEELSRRSVDILLRYEQGDLTDIERVFIAHIMKQTREIHEQGVLTKDYELRRRETMIQALQAKIVDLEVTIARMIKEKENLRQVGPPVVRPVVSLNRWLPQSPADAETTIHSTEDGTVNQNLETPTTAIEVFPTITKPSSSRYPDPKFSQLGCSEDDDSEDDIPLSNLSRVASDDQRVGLKHPRPPSPSVPDEEPIRSKRRTKESLPQKPILPQVPQASLIRTPVIDPSSPVKKVPHICSVALSLNLFSPR